MFSFDPLTIGTLMTLAAGVQAGCEMPKPTSIKVTPKMEKLVVDTSQSHAQIQAQKIGTINPYSYNAVTHTNGYMTGNLGLSAEVKLDYKYVYRNQAVCVWYDTIQINLNLQPKIVIANEVARDKCMYKAVLDHEKKHVKADRKIANQYAQTIGRTVFDETKQRGFMVGPIAPENVEAVMKRMQETVYQIVEWQSKKMEIDRMELQQSVDSLEEYERVNGLCPDYVSPAAASRSR